MRAEEHVVRRLRERTPEIRYQPEHVWDILPAARGLTVVMLDGSVHPLPCGDGAAKQILHAWSVQADAS